MSKVYIEGMEMPDSCIGCKLCGYVENDTDGTDYYICQPLQLFLGDIEINRYCKERHKNCPLKECK